jgi:hypothetical protein
MTELIRAAAVAAFADHGVETAGGERQELLQRLDEEREVRLDLRTPRRRPGSEQSGLGSTRMTVTRWTRSWRAMVPTRHFAT